LQAHPLAEVFPPIEGAEFDRLAADIAEHGLLNPITLYEGKILEGRNRYRACRAADVKPRYVQFEGDDPAAFVISQNLVRRHLGPSERAMVAARIATLKWGQRADYAEGQICLSAAAKLTNVSERSVKSARVVIEQGTADLQDAVTTGRLAVHEAERVARLPVAAQDDFLQSTAHGKTFHSWTADYVRKRRAEELAATATALPVGAKRWPLILADPPWDYEAWNPGSTHTHPSNHYPVMSIPEIRELRVADLAADDCVLFLWATVPHLADTFDVISAWGFAYKSGLVWDKERAGTGFWVLGQHEHLLICTRGNPPLPPLSAVPKSVIRERKREHSRKPEASYRIIEAMYPDLPKLELFARSRREGWSTWGNEVPRLLDGGGAP
jgi:N6-adenosine-specific RNA methylase IME4/ParB-like chromosome segregation protein Spo0J